MAEAVNKSVRWVWLSVLMLPSLVWSADYTFLSALPTNKPAALQLLDVARCGTRLLAVGERGLITYSDDHGVSWQQAEVPVSQTLTAIACPAPDLIWSVGHGGVILSSTDSGESWSLRFDGRRANQQWLEFTERELLSLTEEFSEDATNAELEYALEEAGFAVEDAQLAIETGPVDPFLDIWFRNENYGIAVGAYGMLYRTVDGGKDWTLQAATIDNPDRYHYYSLTPDSDSEAIFLSGEAGLLYRSEDGGDTFQRLQPGYDGSLFGLLALSDGSMICFGLRGNILRSIDGGDSWQAAKVTEDPGLSLYGGLQYQDGTIVLVGAGGVVLHSTDYGLRFNSQVIINRSTLAGISTGPAGQWLAVGMDGVQLLPGRAP